MTTYIVWALETWGHHSSECCAAYSCRCVKADEDGNESHDDDHCDCGYTVNDRSRVGTVEVPEDTDDRGVLRILDESGYIHAHKCTIEDLGDEDINVVSALEGRPLLQLEAE